MPDQTKRLADYTTLQLDPETRDKLRALAKLFQRSMTGQMRFMIARDHAAYVRQLPQPGDGKNEKIPTWADPSA